MKLLLDTQILLRAAGKPERLSAAAHKHLSDPKNDLLFSAASLWEMAIKKTDAGGPASVRHAQT